MFKPLSKLLFLVTVLIAFTGQAMAYHFMSSNNAIAVLQTKVQTQSVANHHTESEQLQDSDDCCQVECCENDCICPANACVSFVYLHTNFFLSESLFLSEPLQSYATKGTYFIASNPYRPPIHSSKFIFP